MKKVLRSSIFNIFNIFDICMLSSFSNIFGRGNVCIDPIGTDGTWRGYSPGYGGINQPDYKEIVYYDCSVSMDCLTEWPCYNIVKVIHTFIWDSSGHFIIKIGPNGDEKFENSNVLYVDGNEAIWNSTELYYEFTNQELANSLIPLTKKCFDVSV